MTTILFITDQPRLQGIFNSIGELPGVVMRMAGSLDHGAEESAAAAPAVVFVQDRLSGLAGSIIARHIHSRLRSNDTKIVLLSDDTAAGSSTQAFVDKCLDLRVSDESLTAAIRESIATLAPGERGGDDDAGPVEKVRDTVSLSSGFPAEVNADEPTGTPAGEGTAEKSRFQDALETVLENHEAVPVRHAETRQLPVEEAPPEAGTTLYGKRVGDYIIREERGTDRFWLLAIASVALAAILFYFLAGGKKQPAKSNAVKPASQPGRVAPKLAPAPAAPTRLPAFIPVRTLDAAYGKAHPGWERYLTDKLEFKVYRKNASIKALQVIDLSGGGMPESFLNEALREVAGKSNPAVATKSEKGSYLIEKGSISAAGRIITYRDKSSLQLKGFVIYFL